jgi:hypothetical protein
MPVDFRPREVRVRDGRRPVARGGSAAEEVGRP